MASNIAWTDQTWNPVLGCSKASPGCANCYAERMAKRLCAMGTRGYTDGVVDGNGWTGKTVLVESELEKPLRWKKPRRIFVRSMSDIFHDSVQDRWIDKVLGVIARCPQHTFQILTKRPDRMHDYFKGAGPCNTWACVQEQSGIQIPEWPLPNLWLGTSIENQATADERIPRLLRCRPFAKVLFVSAEPLLGPVDLDCIDTGRAWPHKCETSKIQALKGGEVSRRKPGGCLFVDTMSTPTLDLCIVGGESGPGARPMHPDWVRSLRDQCAEAGVPFMLKQLGEWAQQGGEHGQWMGKSTLGGHLGIDGEWAGFRGPDDNPFMIRVGKKAAGRTLDGVIHNAFPEVTP